ncbi:hypothetical protein HYH02_007943 [Chlamydomonas schloesseri]|uniref:inositol-1,3,4-trisphosphate 5/6-kinase n=1 Tax=Chlamydomonas schloesseri TaxID=2026947 RepID=A0A836B4A8_9CHLO|nr:hypothetical protein HYH02_007943 [Chlamydomonas schloesseri]|eukprot:KAG2447202.1 hypothetical protein HYH02_007943 [Chlamydomonas schloesseri]
MLLPLREHGGLLLHPPHGYTPRHPHLGPSSFHTARVTSPTQVEINEGCTLSEAQALLAAAGLKPPLLVKPLWTDGREGSHGLAVLHDMAALGKVLHGTVSSELKPPLVVQQFVAHGGVLFKVYVLGQRTVVCQRPSLGENYLGQEAKRAGVLSLPRISCKSTYAKDSPEYRFSAGVIYGTGTRLGTGSGVGLGTGGAAARARAAAPLATSTAEMDACSSGGGADPGTEGGEQDGSGHSATAASAGPDSSDHAPLRRAHSPHSPPPLSPPASPPSTPPHPGSAAEAPAGPVAHTAPAAAQLVPAVALSMVPPEWVTSALSGALREKLGLQLFNFDMICPEQQPAEGERLYHVVDVNYFPGVDKLDNFEQLFVDFLKATCEGEGSTSADMQVDKPAGGCGARGEADAAGGEDGASSVSGEGEAVGLLGPDGGDGEANCGAPAPAAEVATSGHWEVQLAGAGLS